MGIYPIGDRDERREGLLYEPNFVSAEEEGDLVGLLRSLEFEEVKMRSVSRMRFQRGKGEQRHTHMLELEPRSAYVLAGAARSAWQHSIPPTKSLRHSLTFRTLKSS
jgi:alkylated DNA repair dioxygenase AlkB